MHCRNNFDKFNRVPRSLPNMREQQHTRTLVVPHKRYFEGSTASGLQQCSSFRRVAHQSLRLFLIDQLPCHGPDHYWHGETPESCVGYAATLVGDEPDDLG
jgi:hypothetical protein